jgi:HAE1 family hydrophobic/amphiphilic exporter-1
MISRFFIDRPIFANVIAIVTVIIGAITLVGLPVEQYPPIVPPTVQVSTNYPGANAKTVADTVAAPIEEQVNGIENMLYMSSVSAANGSYSLTVTFDVGTNLDVAQVLVQNRVAIAQSSLPEEVKRQGVTTKKQSTNIIMIVTLNSPDGRHDSLFLRNYATLRIYDELTRIYGVGDVRIFGAGQYSMRIWLDPQRLRARNMTTSDVINSIQEQNIQVAAGQVGQAPSPPEQQFQLTVSTLGRLSDIKQFEDIIVKAEGQRVIRLGDIARVELGAQTYDGFFQNTGNPAAGMAVLQLPGANTLETAAQVRATMERLAAAFPEGMTYAIPFDTSLFVRYAVGEVYKTLIAAALLVLLVIMLFLQDWRAVLVPATTVPVTIIGAFAGMAAVGFSINLLTLFGLVLAIGIVVDDAIVIVENAAHHIESDRLGAREATIRAMSEVTGPIFGITLVLMAVFLPTGFLGGITGEMYRQFALTIAVTALISAVNALTLKPAQCALWLRPPRERRNVVYRAFNRVYAASERVYGRLVSSCVRHPGVLMTVFAVLVTVTVFAYRALPTSFIPIEDQGYVIAAIQLPDASSQARMERVVKKFSNALAEIPGIGQWNTIGGFSILENTPSASAATFFIRFKPWEERLPLMQMLAMVRAKFAQIPDAISFVFPPPSIRGLGQAGGFQMMVQDRGGLGGFALQQMVEEVVRDGNSQTGLTALSTTYRAGVPQLFVDVDRVKAKSLGVPLTSVFSTLQSYLGSFYVNDFNLFGRTYQVRVQAEPSFRLSADDIRRLEVRNSSGQMIPLGTLVDVRDTIGPQTITRYNLYPAAGISGQAAPGYSSGQALSLMEQMARQKMPPTMGYEWTGISHQEKKVGGEAYLVFALAVVMVFLVLAAQYESWTSPLAVILVVPLALLGSVAAVAIRGLHNDVYTQIGVVLLIALASKNAILIVEFARTQHARGKPLAEAAVEAARLRYRPILMTSFAFILGVLPLVLAEGPGAESRKQLGTAVFGGMISATLLALVFVPVFFVVVEGLHERWARRRHKTAGLTALAAPAAAVEISNQADS